ncbi:hypothetical protein [Paraburkholderia azotifigens]|jgi:hypothetical protein|uniref:hypothetical protein n=1 Tax=Paraburkholderia azotifigens TaxID=2057004 RepID=UPI00207F48AF|nr:hypothetical protein CBA19CS91_38325 [Paraburkholderia hospita]
MSNWMRGRAASNAMLEAQCDDTNREFYQQLSIRPTNRFDAVFATRFVDKPPAIAAGGIPTFSADFRRPLP